MAVNRKMFEAAMTVARGNPGVKLDVQHSSTYELLLTHEKKQKFWHVNHKGEIRRLTKLPA